MDISKNDLSSAQVVTLNQGLMSLYHASAELQFSKPLSSLLKSILRGLKSGTGISKAAILIKDEASFSLIGSVCIGLNDKKVEALNVLLTVEEEADLLKTAHASLPSTQANPVLNRLTQLFDKELDF